MVKGELVVVLRFETIKEVDFVSEAVRAKDVNADDTEEVAMKSNIREVLGVIRERLIKTEGANDVRR